MSRPAWSFSSLNTFVNCPRQYQKVKVTKEVKDTPSEEIKWGLVVHKALEDRLLKGTALPEHLDYMEPFLTKVASAPTHYGEYKLTLDAEFSPVSWFDKAAWVRGILDVAVEAKDVMWVADYKTGKRRPGSDQLKLAAALVMHSKPQVNKVKAQYIWLKEAGKTDTEEYHRDQLPEIWQHFLPKVARLEAAFEKDKWPAKPSGLCPYCPLTKAHCEFSKK